MSRKSELHVFLRGGLGNQLFQYSTGLAFSSNAGKQLVLRTDLLPMKQDSIGGVSRWPNQISDFIHEGTVRFETSQPEGATNVMGKLMQLERLVGDAVPALPRLFGHLASESKLRNGDIINPAGLSAINSYAAIKELGVKQRSALRDQIRSVVNPSTTYLELSKEISSEPVVAVHVRQGDYIGLEHIYGKGSSAYYGQALALALDHANISKRKIWLFTDSPDQLGKDLLTTVKPERILGPQDLERPIETLGLMSQTNCLIAANSSFSWWVALLTSEGTPVYAPHISKAKVNNFDQTELVSDWNVINV